MHITQRTQHLHNLWLKQADGCGVFSLQLWEKPSVQLHAKKETELQAKKDFKFTLVPVNLVSRFTFTVWGIETHTFLCVWNSLFSPFCLCLLQINSYFCVHTNDRCLCLYANRWAHLFASIESTSVHSFYETSFLTDHQSLVDLVCVCVTLCCRLHSLPLSATGAHS